MAAYRLVTKTILKNQAPATTYDRCPQTAPSIMPGNQRSPTAAPCGVRLANSGCWHCRLKYRVLSFHADESGIETMQVVMVLAVVAIAMIAVKGRWPGIKSWFERVLRRSLGSG
jgi:hypothetical protein